MTTELISRPVPTPDEASAPYFEGARQGRLLLMRCGECGTLRFPARPLCEACWSDEVEWVPASGRGIIYTYGIMHQVYHPAFASLVPYAIVVVELEEGPRMISNLVGVANDQILVGMPVEVVFEEVGEGVYVPYFRPRAG